MDDLYRDNIMDHYERPRQRGNLASPDVSATVSNTLCGDSIRVDVQLSADRRSIADVAFEGHGCVISQAAASMLLEASVGKTVAETRTLEVRDVLDLLGVSLSVGRIKCAALGLTALKRSLEKVYDN